MKKMLLLILSLVSSAAFSMPTVSFLSQQQLIDEGTFHVRVMVQLSEPTNDYVHVPFVTHGSASFPFDHNLAPEGFFVIAPGQTVGMINFNYYMDNDDEGEENITIDLMAPQNAILGDIISHEVIITDNSFYLPSISFTNTEVTVNEGDSVTIKATLSEPSTQIIFAPVIFWGTATSGVDHNFIELELMFAPGQTSTTITINTYQDEDEEGMEDLFLAIRGPMNNSICGPNCTTKIMINDSTK